MGYVRGIVEHGLSYADQQAPKSVGMVTDLVERALQVPQISQLSQKALPLAQRFDDQVSQRVDSGLDLYGSKKQELVELKAKLEQELSGRKEQASELKAKLEQELSGRKEQASELKAKLEQELSGRKEQASELKAKLEQELSGRKEQASELLEQKVQDAKQKLTAEYSKKKAYTLQVTEDAKATLAASKQQVQSTLQQQKEDIQAVLPEGSVAQLSVVQALLSYLEGTVCQQPALRAVDYADLLLPSVRRFVLALPQTLDELKQKAEAQEEPLKAKLAAAKQRAAEAAGRVRSEVESAKAQAVAGGAKAQALASQLKAQAEAQAAPHLQLLAEVCALGKEQAGDYAGVAHERLAEAQEQLRKTVQQLVQQHSGLVAQVLVQLFGEEAVQAGYETAKPLLPQGVQDWVAQVDGLD